MVVVEDGVVWLERVLRPMVVEVLLLVAHVGSRALALALVLAVLAPWRDDARLEHSDRCASVTPGATLGAVRRVPGVGVWRGLDGCEEGAATSPIRRATTGQVLWPAARAVGVTAGAGAGADATDDLQSLRRVEAEEADAVLAVLVFVQPGGGSRRRISRPTPVTKRHWATKLEGLVGTGVREGTERALQRRCTGLGAVVTDVACRGHQTPREVTGRANQQSQQIRPLTNQTWTLGMQAGERKRPIKLLGFFFAQAADLRFTKRHGMKLAQNNRGGFSTCKASLPAGEAGEDGRVQPTARRAWVRRHDSSTKQVRSMHIQPTQ